MASLVARGHNATRVHSEFQKIIRMPRSATRQKRQTKNVSKTMFITTYNPNAPDIKSIISRNMHILQSDNITSKLFPSISTVFKSGKNLRECILRADPLNIRESLYEHSGGSTHCGKSCNLCDSLTHDPKFTSFATKRVFTTRKAITCKTECVIYLLHCQNCKHQGVGSTSGIKKTLG